MRTLVVHQKGARKAGQGRAAGQGRDEHRLRGPRQPRGRHPHRRPGYVCDGLTELVLKLSNSCF